MAGVVDNLIRQLRMAAAKAKRTKDRTGRFDTTTVFFAMPAHVALLTADRLEQTQGGMTAKLKAQRDMRELAEIAEESMKDNTLRFHYAMTDLEFFLQDVMGRQPMTLQEVREQRQIHEARPSPGPQPFVRRKPAIRISPELGKTIRRNRMGNPREPGEDG